MNKTNKEKEVLEKLIEEQLQTVLGREAGMRVLKEMPKDRILTSMRDPDSLKMKNVTVEERLREMEETYKIEESRLKELEKMLKEKEYKIK